MKNKNVAHLPVEYYSAIKTNEIMTFKGKWLELEIIIMGEINHFQICVLKLEYLKNSGVQ